MNSDRFVREVEREMIEDTVNKCLYIRDWDTVEWMLQEGLTTDAIVYLDKILDDICKLCGGMDINGMYHDLPNHKWEIHMDLDGLGGWNWSHELHCDEDFMATKIFHVYHLERRTMMARFGTSIKKYAFTMMDVPDIYRKRP